MFTFEKTIQLLKNGFFTDVIEKPRYKILKSIFKESVYNNIVPLVPIEELDKAEIDLEISKFQKQCYSFSYYLSDRLIDSYRDFLKNYEFQFAERYVYLENTAKFEIDDTNIIEASEANLQNFITSAEICFPEWSSIRKFTKWCFTSTLSKLVGVKISEEIVSLGAYYTKVDSNYVLLINDATLPVYRRKGLHHTIIKARINEVLDKKKSAIFYAQVEDGDTSYKSYKKLGFKDGPLYFVYA